MIERGFIAQKTKEFQIKRYLENRLSKVGLSKIKLKKIPLGEKITIYTSRPNLVVGSRGANIKDLTRYLKKEFKLENPQIEINEIKEVFLDAQVVAEKIATSLERHGSARFKGIGHKMMENVIKAGALGVEIILSGKIPGARAKPWRFYQGYLKKCGDISLTGVRKAKKTAALKSGIIGIKVAIMPPDIKLPDKIEILEEATEVIDEVKEEKKAKEEPKKKSRKKEEKETKEEKEGEKPRTKDSRPKTEADIPPAEELIRATKERFEPEEKQKKLPKKLSAEEIIEQTKKEKP